MTDPKTPSPQPVGVAAIFGTLDVPETDAELLQSLDDVRGKTAVGICQHDLNPHAKRPCCLDWKPAPSPLAAFEQVERPTREHMKQFHTSLFSFSFVQYAEFKRYADAIEKQLATSVAHAKALQEQLDGQKLHTDRLNGLLYEKETAAEERIEVLENGKGWTK